MADAAMTPSTSPRAADSTTLSGTKLGRCRGAVVAPLTPAVAVAVALTALGGSGDGDDGCDLVASRSVDDDADPRSHDFHDDDTQGARHQCCERVARDEPLRDPRGTPDRAMG